MASEDWWIDIKAFWIDVKYSRLAQRIRNNVNVVAIALVLLFLIVLIAGCARAPGIYFEAGVGYKIDEMTDILLRTDSPYGGGRNPTAHFELGYEFADNPVVDECGYNHFSHIRDGGPFNNRPETYMDTIQCRKRWGGR